ncbi:MAG: prolyl oligopeptidase family serine peptidase [Acidobacteria bacterium]|nr:prolyl oligopeptidase family serine peptidase [Acidobacteriota bacterium]
MPQLMTPPPYSALEPVSEILHGVAVTDPYRWLEDQDSPRTRAWIEEQTRYARGYLDSIPGRERIRERIREFLTVETYDSLQIAGNRYFFRKRLPDQEQPCIYMREGNGEDQLLIDPSERGTGKYTAVKPLRVSPDGRLLLYEVKQGGERTGTFELLEIATRQRLPDLLPRGYLRGFGFAPDCKSFYYVHEALDAQRPFYRAAYHHILGTPPSEDREIFFAGEDDKIRLILVSDKKHLAFFVRHFLERTFTDIYLKPFDVAGPPDLIFRETDCMLGLRLMQEKLLAITDRNAPNRRIVEIRLREDGQHEWMDIVPESDRPIHDWHVVGDCVFVSYMKDMTYQVLIFDFRGQKLGEIPIRGDETLRMLDGLPDGDELLFETESFTEPVGIFRYSAKSNNRTLWAKKRVPFDSAAYSHSHVWFRSKDGTRIPMFLVGRREVLNRSSNPTIMTSYGGYGVSMTPQFSVFVALLMERDCLFALPNIRGGLEFGIAWHNAAKRRKRQTAYDDFLCAAEWLIKTGRTDPKKLAIFGGSNSGLLVGAALTQRPDLFRAVVCMVPMLDMLRYHLFDNAHVWKDEFGAADDPEDFGILAKYSPYHQVRDGVTYPATMIVSGDADRNCNPLHARKMTARLQAANSSQNPILLDYKEFRGHSPVLPLSERIEGLSDRLSFVCDQLEIPV